jgi:hypothetical protein
MFFAEKERAKDATFRKQSAGKVLRSDAQQLTDDDLPSCVVPGISAGL